MEYYDLENQRLSGQEARQWCEENLPMQSKCVYLEIYHLNKSGKPVKTYVCRTGAGGGRFLLNRTVKIKD